MLSAKTGGLRSCPQASVTTAASTLESASLPPRNSEANNVYLPNLPDPPPSILALFPSRRLCSQYFVTSAPKRSSISFIIGVTPLVIVLNRSNNGLGCVGRWNQDFCATVVLLDVKVD